MKKVLLTLLLAGCFDGPEQYEYPYWGDPCVPDTDPAVFHPCQHGDFYGVGGPDPGYGFCEPQEDGGGKCRPFCGKEFSCPEGTTPEIETIWYKFCYCTEKS